MKPARSPNSAANAPSVERDAPLRELVFSRVAAAFYRRAKGAVYQEMETELARLASYPHLPADLHDRGEDGRPVRVRFLRRCAITFALDDAMREVRVILIEPLGR